MKKNGQVFMRIKDNMERDPAFSAVVAKSGALQISPLNAAAWDNHARLIEEPLSKPTEL